MVPRDVSETELVSDFPGVGNDNAAWNRALVDRLFPVDEKPESARLLAIDEDVIVAVGATLGFSADAALPAFVKTINDRWSIARTGSFAILAAAANGFARLPRPRQAPPFVSGLSLLVLAASGMRHDEAAPANAYYARLAGIVGVGRTEFLAASEIPGMFERLAEWLRADVGGRRGRLLLPGGGYKYVGVPINQCVFRAFDRAALADFFTDRLPAVRPELDVLAMLRAWPGRHRLSAPATRLLHDPAAEDQVRAALSVVRDAWNPQVDWTQMRASVAGGRRFPGRLRMRVTPEVELFVSSEADISVSLADGRWLSPGREAAVATSLLDQLAKASVRFSTGGTAVVLPFGGDTLYFEHQEEYGIVRVLSVQRDRAYVLSRDPAVHESLAEYEDENAELPTGWRLFLRVAAEDLPSERKAPELKPLIAPKLDGGLRVDRMAWLTGAGPMVRAGHLASPIEVKLDGESLGELEAGGCVFLPCADTLKCHEVEVGETRWTVRIVEQGPRAGIGTLGWRPESLDTNRHGAAALDEVKVTGAVVESWDLSETLLCPPGTKVTSIDHWGTGKRISPELRPRWLTEIGFEPERARWELFPTEDDVWIVSERMVVCLDPSLPPLLDDVARKALLAVHQPRVLGVDGPDARVTELFAALRQLAEAHT
ncbi:hypothetical protein OJ998_12035 [Solirubrobacter taibaiensis]|nr:hypothetical protein [Solirubrobacter taibaiensis]